MISSSRSLKGANCRLATVDDDNTICALAQETQDLGEDLSVEEPAARELLTDNATRRVYSFSEII